ncbi:MAG: hypothetical protein WCJ30_22300 [Deltaproteobacteria bacterium]
MLNEPKPTCKYVRPSRASNDATPVPSTARCACGHRYDIHVVGGAGCAHPDASHADGFCPCNAFRLATVHQFGTSPAWPAAERQARIEHPELPDAAFRMAACGGMVGGYDPAWITAGFVAAWAACCVLASPSQYSADDVRGARRVMDDVGARVAAIVAARTAGAR